MGLQRVSVTLEGSDYFGNVHEMMPSREERIIPIYLRDAEGVWRAKGEPDGERPEPEMEELLNLTESEARARGVPHLSGRWTESGPEFTE
jgi:hypothetical protein